VRIDGHDVGASFEGYVFQGMPVTLSLAPGSGRKFDYWRVNGQPQARRLETVTVTASSDLTVQAVFR
jgi:hypothetical protein